MSDLQIVAGGAVAVDTESLRALADRLARVMVPLRAAVDRIDVAAGILTRSAQTAVEATLLPSHAARCADAAGDVAALADAARVAADGYEVVELRAAREFAALAGDDATVAAIEGMLAVMRLRAPEAFVRADEVEGAWRAARGRELTSQVAWGSAFLGVGASSALAMLVASLPAITAAHGLVPPERALSGSAAGAVRRLPPEPGRTSAPRGIADLAARIPSGSDARVRVERYERPGGARFVVYITGTQGIRDEWGAASNLHLYAGETSSSWAATLAALSAAGAREGDSVIAVGHSQGAMIASALAESTDYDVEACVTFGNPVDVAAGAETMNIQVRHDDDPVSALAAGGHIAPSGAAGSFVATRTADPTPGMHDLALPAHALTAYEQTGAMLDAATDPRLSGIRGLLGELALSPPPEVSEYAEALSPSGGGAG